MRKLVCPKSVRQCQKQAVSTLSKSFDNEIFETNMATKIQPKKFQGIFKFILESAEIYISSDSESLIHDQYQFSCHLISCSKYDKNLFTTRTFLPFYNTPEEFLIKHIILITIGIPSEVTFKS